MRKHIQLVALAAVGALMICSCEKGKDVENLTPASTSVNFTIVNTATRSEAMPSVRSFNYDLGEVIEGYRFSLAETVAELDDFDAEAPETRGTPVYTQNLQQVYGSTFNGVIYGASGEVVGDGAFEASSTATNTAWRRSIGFNPFEVSDPLAFFLRMPATQNGVTNLAYYYSSGSMAFDYTSPATASDQQDIIFATRQLTEETYQSEFKSKGGAQLLFRHALTGIKFAVASYDESKGIVTTVKSVTVKGLKDTGHASFKPDNSQETNTDITDKYSSATSFTWTNLSTTRTNGFTQSYSSTLQTYSASNNALNAPESFYAAGEKRNLNDANASLTFWFVPQAITNSLTLTVTFNITDGNTVGDDVTLTLDLGKMIVAQSSDLNKEWKAGQIRTFTLKPEMIDVDITDDVSGFVKNNVQIRNTGNVDAFIRAAVVANWYGLNDSGEDGIAVGYNSSAHTAFVNPWQRTSLTGDNFGGVFTGLPGSDWVLKSDGFFYYTKKVAPGEVIPSPLFTQYSLDTSAHPAPRIWYLSTTSGYKEFTNVRLVMEIPVQAIDAADYNSYTAAWAAAGVSL